MIMPRLAGRPSQARRRHRPHRAAQRGNRNLSLLTTPGHGLAARCARDLPVPGLWGGRRLRRMPRRCARVRHVM